MNFRGIIGGGGWTTRTFLPRVLEAIRMCDKDDAHVAIFPTFLEDDDLPCSELDDLVAILSGQLGADNVRTLTSDTQKMPNRDRARDLLKWADVIIIFGGLFPELMERLRKTHIDDLLREAAASGEKVFTGSSSGMIVWFAAAQTNELTLAEARKQGEFHTDEYHWESGLGLFPAFVGPHYNEFSMKTGRSRSGTMERQMMDEPIGRVAVGVPTNASLVIDGGSVTIATDDPSSWVQRLERNSDNIEDGLKLTIHRRGDAPIPIELFFGPTP